MRPLDKHNIYPFEIVEEKISAPRLRPYLQACEGDSKKAILLYEWNNSLSAALWELIAILEVGIRNTIDTKMSERHLRLGREGHWIFDVSHELGSSPNKGLDSKKPFEEVEQAIARVRRNKKPLVPSQIISETSFGFWNQLVSKKQGFLWPDLASGFPYAPSRDQRYISILFTDIRDLRNRISHHHRLQNPAIERGELIILEMAKALHPEYCDWLMSVSRVSQIQSQRP
jgi:hypothetical protein